MILEVARIEPQQLTGSETFNKIEVILVHDGDTLRYEQRREVEACGRPGNWVLSTIPLSASSPVIPRCLPSRAPSGAPGPSFRDRLGLRSIPFFSRCLD